MSASDAAPARVTPLDTRAERPGITLAVIVACQLMIAIDGTVMNVALPTLKQSLGFTETGLSWVPTSYALAFGGLLLLGGRAGDILGRRVVFTAGVAVFTQASLLGGLAPTAGWLIVARVAQGVGAALAGPSTLSLITSSFAEGAERNRALGIFSTVAGLGLAVGLIVGGLLTQLVSWRWVLLINVPIGAAILALALRHVRETPRHAGRFDTVGALTSTLGMTLLVYGLIRVAVEGWGDVLAVATLAAGVVLLALFTAVEARAEQPVMPLRLFAERRRAFAFLTMLLLAGTMIGMFFFLIQFLQNVLGFTPLVAGVAFLPMAVALFWSARTAPKALPKLGPTRVMTVGALAVVIGVAWLTRLAVTSTYVGGVLVSLILFGVGIGFSFMPLNMVILSGLPPRDIGAASGVLQTM